MQFLVFYSDGRQPRHETIMEASDHRAAAQQLFQQHPVTTDRRINAEMRGSRDYSIKQFQASEFMDASTRASLVRAASVAPEPAAAGPSGLVTALRVLAAFEFIGGFVCFAVLLSQEPSPVAAAIGFLMAGIVFGCLFLAIAEALAYLREIRDALTRKT